MTSDKLAKSYLEKAKIRLEVLKFMHERGGYSDVVREAQECVELLTKSVCRTLGIEVPKIHDDGRMLKEKSEILVSPLKENIDELVVISRRLRKERELAFYGTDDWIPTEEYTSEDSQAAIDDANKVYDWVSKALLDK